MTGREVLEADLTWTGGTMAAGIQVTVEPDGRIGRVGSLGLTPTRRLRGSVLLPGFINVHSHAFQRGLRGRGERFPAGLGTFWSWREAMYELVEVLEPEPFRRLCVQAYREMLRAGITTVGEFHYLHHSSDQLDYSLDDVVLEAAREAGIRLVLLQAYYRTGGIGQPLAGGQRRFASTSLRHYWDQMDRLAGKLEPDRQQLGAVAHSIRAASLEEIAGLQAEARRRGMVLHLHVEEQRRELEESLDAYGQRPLALLNNVLGTAGNVTAVHCTHSEPDDLARFLEGGGRVCICPLTEANLGDGIPDLPPVQKAGARLSLGTDSNARISMLEEMRWLEYGQRLSRESRGLLGGTDGRPAVSLLQAATLGGASALGVNAGRITPGTWADLVVANLASPALAGIDEDNIPEAFVFGCGDDVLTDVCVGGRWTAIRDGEES